MLVDGVRRVHLPSLFSKRRIVYVDECCAEGGHRHAPGVVRDRLCWPHLLARHVGFGRHHRFDHGMDRFASLPMPEIQQAVLTGSADSFNRLTIPSDIEENRPGYVIPVPEIVMDRLVVPG